jgi:hypothetical protein
VTGDDIRVPKNYQETLHAPAPSPAADTGTKKSWRAVDTAHTYTWGWLPLLSLTSAFGLLLVAVADTLSRSAAGQYEALFWAGLLLMIVPIAARLAAKEASRGERIGLIILLGLGFYLVKVLHSPYGFIFSDELVHSYNGTTILETGKLFSANPILQVTPFYPGLETVTAALASLSGLSIFDAGLAVVGVARLIAMLALFLFFEKVSGSLRLAGIAALFYATNANFLFWSAQFSYESLALPLAMWVLYVAILRAATPAGAQHRGLTLIAMLGISAVVITHHLTSYFLVAFFGMWALVLLILRLKAGRAKPATNVGDNFSHSIVTKSQAGTINFNREGSVYETVGLAVFSTLVTLAWLIGVASITPGYLSPVLSRAATSIIQILSGAGATRELFQSASGYSAPLWERFAGIGSVVLMVLALPFGLAKIWQNFRRNPIAILLAGAGLTYFLMLGLRFSPAAWETGNRASEFLYIGLSFVMALAVLQLWDRKRRPWLGRGVVLGSFAIILMGGVISGWAPKLRLSQPVQFNVGNVVIRPQGFAAAYWMRAALGPGNWVATDESNGRLMLAYGGQLALAGKHPDVKDLLGTVDFPNWQMELLRQWDIQYIVLDRRLISADNMAGYYFDRTSTGRLTSADLLPPGVYGKFDQVQTVSRLFDSGNIVIYDVGAISNAKTVP